MLLNIAFDYLFAASIGLAIFIICLILGKRMKQLSDYLLMVWLSVFLIDFLAFFFISLNKNARSLKELLLFELAESSIYLHGPMLYFYASSLTTPGFKIKKLDFIHLIPFFMATIALFYPLFEGNEIGWPYRNLLLVGKIASILIYTILTLQRLYSHKNKVKDLFSNTETKYLTWLSVIAWGIMAVWLIASISIILERFINVNIPLQGSGFTNIAISILLFVMGYFGVRQPSLFVEHSKFVLSPDEKTKKEAKVKYDRSGLSTQDANTVHKKLIRCMLNEKPYLNPDLNLYSLAKLLDIRPNHLSQIINSMEKKNFFDFVNEYRVQEVKKNLAQDDIKNLSLLGIAFESGFNSKASFNRAFRKIEGTTPSKYKEKL